MENCPKCGLPVADGAKFCAACGTRMPQKLIKSKVCSVCGNTLNAGLSSATSAEQLCRRTKRLPTSL